MTTIHKVDIPEEEKRRRKDRREKILLGIVVSSLAVIFINYPHYDRDMYEYSTIARIIMGLPFGLVVFWAAYHILRTAYRE